MDPAFNYQEQGAAFLAERKFALLADEMGLGKSRQAIMACDKLKAGRALVLCPAVARINWCREFQEWQQHPRTVQAVLSGRDRIDPNATGICSYDLVDSLPDYPWDVLVLDEFHYLKSTEAGRAKKVLGKKGVAHRADRVWGLSGTPAPNNASELWIMLYTWGLTRLTYDQFVERYCTGYRDQWGFRITGTDPVTLPELQRMLAKVMLRRRKKDVGAQLPPITYADHLVEPGEVDLEIYYPEWFIPEDRSSELMTKIRQQQDAFEQALTTTHSYSISKARDQLRVMEAMAGSVSTMRQFTGLQKVEPVLELVKSELEANAYRKVVLFAQHRHVIVQLRDGLRKYGAVQLFGGTKPESRQKYIDKFQDPNSKTRVFVGNIQAAGTAISLTAAHNVIFVEQSWVPGENVQAISRCHRRGQENPVFVRFIGIAGTIDERVARVLRLKSKDLLKLLDD